MSLSKEEADRLHRQYGNTIEGLRLRRLWNNDKSLQENMKHCYQEIWPNSMDYSPLLQLHQPPSQSFTTGYSHNHDSASQQLAQLRALLEQMPCPLYVASNSPSWHVKTVLQALGMLNVPWSGMVTPDQPRATDSDIASSNAIYPTKHSPSIFYQDILHRHKHNNNNNAKVVLVDDSQTNINVLPKQLMTGIRVTPANPLSTALLQAIGVIQKDSGDHDDDDDNSLTRIWRNLKKHEKPYEFSQVQYLQSKNIVDAVSVHRPTWIRLADELRAILLQSVSVLPATNTTNDHDDDDKEELHIADVGAGLLSVFQLILEGDNNHDNGLPSLIDRIFPADEDTTDNINALFQHVRYFAYEPNRELQSECFRILQTMGFKQEEEEDVLDKPQQGQQPEQDEYIFVGTRNGRNITVHLRLYDYNSEDDNNANSTTATKIRPDPHLIVGCCFADLMDPYQLVPSLLHRFLSTTKSNPKKKSMAGRPEACLCYFPITFQGITQFVPPQPFDIRPGKAQSLPSDTAAFALYSNALEEIHGHNLDPLKLVQAMKAFGGTVVSSGGANWDIDPKQHPYLWQTLLYFFERVAGPELIKHGWDASGWLQRARSPPQTAEQEQLQSAAANKKAKIDCRPSILVSNVDLLFRLPRLGCAEIASLADAGSTNEAIIKTALEQQEVGMEEIQFTAPYKVSTIRKLGAELGPHQVQIKSEYSLISSGTELKIYKGLFDDAALDVNIKGMEEERMAYPLAYGYSLVGRVVQCGSNVDDAEELLGRLVFTFSAHATHVITDRDAIQVVPDGVEAKDAIFMPSVETALSMVHDAHVRLGEKVAVFGQGLIGLLVTLILCNTLQQGMDLQAPCCGNLVTKMGTVTTFDAIPARLAASAAMGASQALLPSEVRKSGPFDVAIEVSGNAKALQAAIDNTSNHGRLVVGSWYGNGDVTLKLGIDFHRSHKTIITSQVSEIKAELAGLWSKERRFGLTWELVRKLRPSRLITMQTSLGNAQIAYERLDEGSEIAVAFDYSDAAT